MNPTNGRLKMTSLLLCFCIVAPSLPASAIEFEGLPEGSIRPVIGVKPVNTPMVDFHAIPGLDAALKSPVTLQLPALGSVVPALPISEMAEPQANVSAPELQPQHEPAGIGQISQQVSAQIESVGDVSSASAGDAADLGGKLQRTIGGGAAGDSGAAVDASGLTAEQNSKLAQLKAVVRLYTEHYAPIEEKEKTRHVDFIAEYQKAREAIIKNPGMKDHEFQVLLADFVAATQDYHAGITFFSTEKSSLALMILNAQGKHYIAYVDRGALSKSQFPYSEGDEVVKIGGQDVDKLAASFTKSPNTAETDARLADMHLTNRSRRSGMDVPQGPVELEIRTDDGKLHTAKLEWSYSPEIIPTDVPRRGPVLGPETSDPLKAPPPPPAKPSKREEVKNLIQKFLPTMAHPLTGPFSEMAASNPDNGFMIGGKKTYVPELGKVVWELPAQIAMQIPFVVKIYEDASGRKIGYLRIPDYMGGGNTDAATQLLEKIMEKLQAETDGLVIDQVNNPGGDMFFMNDVASMLTDKPLTVAKHRLMIDESDAALAAQILKQAQDPGVMQDMEDVLHEMMAGFSGGSAGMVKQLVDYADFVLSELKAGRRLTDPTYIFGVQKIQPHPTTRYTKPVIVLINELDFSAADFFAALMQDNGRATLFGVRTAGAGGAVKSVEFPNQYGIEHVAYTWTIAIRPSGKTIENNGVQPDEKYEITPDDLRSGFSGYGKTLGALIKKLFPTGTAVTPPADPTGDDSGQTPKPRRTRRKPGPRPE